VSVADAAHAQPVPPVTAAAQTSTHTQWSQWSPACYNWTTMPAAWPSMSPWFWPTIPYWAPYGYVDSGNASVPPPPPPPPAGHTWKLVATGQPDADPDADRRLGNGN
jgi:hypothetical protein